MSKQATGVLGVTANIIAKYWLLVGIAVLATIALFYRLGATSLNGNDEAIYAQVAKQILHTHNWITLSWYTDSYKWFDKPPLYMWMTAILFKLFGTTAFWARFVSAVAGVGVAITTFLLGRRLFDQSVGAAAALIVVLNLLFLTYGRSGMLDTLLTLCFCAALFSYLKAESDTRWWMVVGIFLGLGIMTKGAAAITIVLTLAAIVAVSGRARRTLRCHYFWYGLGLALVIALPWHLLAWDANGTPFLNNYFGYNVIKRASQPIEGHIGTSGYYLGTLQSYFQPWFLFIPFAMAYAMQQLYERKKQFLVPFVSALVPFLFFSLAVQTKLDWYIVPMLPGLAILIAVFVIGAYRERSSLAFWATLWVVAYLALTVPLHKSSRLILLVLTVICLAYSLYRKQLTFKYLTLTFLIFLSLLALTTVRPLYSRGESPLAEIGTYASEHGPISSPVVIYGSLTDPAASVLLRFYIDRPIDNYMSSATSAPLLGRRASANIIIDDSLLPSLQGYKVTVMAKRGGYDYGTITK
jgi:uncharacterized membrane protein